MGSTFTTFPDKFDQTNIFGGKRKLPIYLQFVPGIVTDVVTAQDSGKYEGVKERIGSIKALPHVGVSGLKKGSMLPEKHRYWPLFRGIQDIPVKGDPVLLCTIGDRNYYLGPLNTEGDPNFNEDQYGLDQVVNEYQVDGNEINGTTPMFLRRPVERLQKIRNNVLDNPKAPHGFIDDQIHGDVILEGRHGNSLRIGSRNINPYIIFSNGRTFGNPVETTLDGTIFSITKHGSIRQHFMHDKKYKPDFNQGIDSDDPLSTNREKVEYHYEFKLASDEFPETNAYRSIRKTFNSSLGRGLGPHKDEFDTAKGENDPDIEKTIYQYNGNQAFLSSDRITFNSRRESMFLSSRQFIHMGAGNTLTFSANNTCLFTAGTRFRVENTPLVEIYSTSEVYVDGRDKITLGRPTANDYVQPAVMGDSLVVYLTTLIQEIKNLAHITASAIEQRKQGGAAVDLLHNFANSLDDMLGMEAFEDEETQTSYEIPKGMTDIILSKKVFLKK